MKDFDRWLGKKIDEFFNPISAIIEHQEKHFRVYRRGSERENKSTPRTFGTLGDLTVRQTSYSADFVIKTIKYLNAPKLSHYRWMTVQN